jgi:glycosyltransferase involved in cell wall biosynthesis
MTDRPRIAVIVSHPIQHFCPQYASFAENKNIQVKVFFASSLGWKKYADPGFNQEISWDNLYLAQFDHVFLNDGAILPPDKDLDAPMIGEALDQYHPDMLIVYGYFQRFQRRAYRWAIKNKARVAYISDSERNKKENRLKEWLKYPFIRSYFSGIDYFLTVGDANERFYSYYSVPSRKIIRMHFSIDIKYYEKSFACRERMRKETRQRYAIPENEIVLSVVGKLVPWKKQGDIIDAMKLLEARGCTVHLFVVGSGETMPVLQQKANSLSASKVYFTGFIKPENLPAIYAATDVYIHPATVEPHSLAISEAIYMGCTVLIGDRCGSYGKNDDVQDGYNGLVFKSGNMNDLADKLNCLLEDPSRLELFGNRSHELAVNFQERSHYGVVDELVSKF